MWRRALIGFGGTSDRQTSDTSASGHERRFRELLDAPGLPSTPESDSGKIAAAGRTCENLPVDVPLRQPGRQRCGPAFEPYEAGRTGNGDADRCRRDTMMRLRYGKLTGMPEKTIWIGDPGARPSLSRDRSN
jgi:hypothetical protein